jgi:hypothetical protein
METHLSGQVRSQTVIISPIRMQVNIHTHIEGESLRRDLGIYKFELHDREHAPIFKFHLCESCPALQAWISWTFNALIFNALWQPLAPP